MTKQRRPVSNDALRRLYNAIMNDASIQHFTLGWKSVVDLAERTHHTIEKTDEQFTNELLDLTIKRSTGELRSILEAFKRELDINRESLRY
jgi:hypothetical protein